jgi:hypothetical protein
LAKLLSAYQLGAFVAPNRITLAEFVEPWLDGLENQGVKATTRVQSPPRRLRKTATRRSRRARDRLLVGGMVVAEHEAEAPRW